MPEVYLDGSKLDIEDSGNNSTVGELAAIIENEIRQLDRLIAEVHADGKGVTDWKTAPFLKIQLSGLKELKFKTAAFPEIALSGLNLVSEYITHIKERASECVSEIRVGGAGERLLGEVFEGSIEVMRTMDSLSSAGSAQGQSLFREDPERFFKPMLGLLESMKMAAGAGDRVLLTDILEYEFLPFLNEMESSILISAQA